MPTTQARWRGHTRDGRSSPCRGPAGLDEPFVDRQGKARQDIAAVQDPVFVEQDRAIAAGINTNGSPPGIGVPNQADSGTEVLIELACHFLGSVSLGQHFDDQVGNDQGDLPSPPGGFGIARP